MIAVTYSGYQKLEAKTVGDKETKAATKTDEDTLRYAASAPQLAYINIKPVVAYPEPLVEPLNARIGYDENKTARITSPIAGRVLRLVAETGKTVQAGETLALIDSPDYAQAVSDASKGDADLKLKQQARERAKILYDGQVLALKDYEQAQSDYRIAEAEALRAHQRLQNLGADKGERQKEFVLRAPIAGIVSERQANPGTEVQPGSNSLFVVTDPQHLWVLVDVPERDIFKIKVGQPALVEVDAYPGKIFNAKIAVIGAVLDPLTRRIQVRCTIDNGDGSLRPEMFARVTPVADVHSSLPRIPNTAIVTRGLHSYVFVELSPGVLQRRKVTLALQGHDESYVRDGLKGGEKVATSGALLLDSELSGGE